MKKKQTKTRKSKIQTDPYLKREQSKYDSPIASREFIIQHLKFRGAPANRRELEQELQLTKPEQQEALTRRLRAMLRDKQLEYVMKRKFWPVEARILVEGKIVVEKGRNLWVIPDEGGPKISVVNPASHLIKAGSQVIVSVLDAQKVSPPDGRIIEVISKQQVQLTGRLIEDFGTYFVSPFNREINQDIIIPAKKTKGAQQGDVVIVEVLPQKNRHSEPVGRVVEVLGQESDAGIEVKAVINSYDIPNKWDPVVKQQLKKINKKISAADWETRVDLTELPLVTIDGEDAKDFDDAVYCEPKPKGGWRLYVAIADVSHYVQPGTPLDAEAQTRGNSVYFPSQVIPMLPEVLSNDLCSLRPNVPRLAMVCEMQVSSSGRVSRYEFYRGVIESHARLTYTEVAQMLEEDNPRLQNKYADLLEPIYNLHDLYQTLSEQRRSRGAIDFETVETRFVFGKNGKVKRIDPVERNVAHKVIEECMLAANVATARFLQKNDLPGIYRVHEGPPDEKLTNLRAFLAELGLSLGKGKDKPKPLHYGELLNKIKHRADAHVIQMVLLRSLCQAVYSPDNLGHFGLAYPAYTHFTSPIRRYPDLLVHRQIASIVDPACKPKRQTKKSIEEKKEQLEQLAAHCSQTERRADDATRDVARWFKCQYMCQYIGDTFNGIISSVTRFGFFVEITDIFIDGLVHINSLADDYYEHHANGHKLVGKRSGQVYALGMPVQVRVARVSIDERRIDFDLYTSKKSKAKAKKTKKDKKKRKKAK